ncbi:HypC/HybG/HupF family hydrogenase formation chaperone [candidate division CSSED10-310 bacterium]|uniref:HypC/HybG/HupF family hydrogenase formation chaperone n=1 Tax=candidate division CSSED10-310 bacterium TaxID=2855610 RepID=A0ABV6YWI1_UNCC1
MCLAIPAKILSIEDECATIEVGSLKQTCYLGLVPEVKVGDYVIVHAGYAISSLDEDEALKTLDLFRQLAEIQDDEDAVH